MLELMGSSLPDAVGGMAIGADPITAAIITVAGRSGKKLRGFIVRKEAKQHGTGRDVEFLQRGCVVATWPDCYHHPRFGLFWPLIDHGYYGNSACD